MKDFPASVPAIRLPDIIVIKTKINKIIGHKKKIFFFEWSLFFITSSPNNLAKKIFAGNKKITTKKVFIKKDTDIKKQV